MEWFSIDIALNDETLKDVLSDYVFSMGCSGIQDLEESTFEDKTGLRLFFEKNEDPDLIKNSIELFLKEKGIEDIPEFNIETIPERNWREEWKKTYSPVESGDFLIVPAWQKTDTGLIKILIEPKMAFGTGTHETTKLMLKEISSHDLTGKSIFEAGCGSGILSIACVKKGAVSVTAVDIDEESYDNCKENSRLNGVDGSIRVKFTNDEDYEPENVYDIVIANINRKVLEELIPRFKRIVKPEGMIILSGILKVHSEKIYSRIHDIGGLITDGYYEMNEWCLIRLIKKQT